MYILTHTDLNYILPWVIWKWALISKVPIITTVRCIKFNAIWVWAQSNTVGQNNFFTIGFQMHQRVLVHHTSGGFAVCVLFWHEVLLPDELGPVSVLVTAYRTCVDCQRPPVNTDSRGVHRQAVQQLGHHLQTCLGSMPFLSTYTHLPKQ